AVVAMGKAAGAMAEGAVAVFGALPGLVVTKDGHHPGPPGFEVRYAAHPIPDARGAVAAARLREVLAQGTAPRRILALLSGGASALLADPRPGLTLGDLRVATRALLASGLPIDAVNAVRRRLSASAGGRLATLADGAIEVLVMSDVLSDDLAAIASGPFFPDPTSADDVRALVAAVPGLPPAVRAVIAASDEVEPRARVEHRILARHADLLAAAEREATAVGWTVQRGEVARGSVEAAAARLVALAAQLASGTVLVAGGEPTVELPAEPGLGGRNQHLALLVARGLAGGPPRSFVALGSDGSDGPTDAAGAWVDEQSWARFGARGPVALARADAHPLLAAQGQLIESGPTGTNLLDLHLLAAP
ncbi:MAG: DUF4147 domain-containing protein, partial [Myxococcales bacterium]|nr:DUF4147 domain-containing protein [Myxococcales bacterium]